MKTTIEREKIYEDLMFFIGNVHSAEVLKDMLIDAIDNNDYEDLYRNYKVEEWSKKFWNA